MLGRRRAQQEKHQERLSAWPAVDVFPGTRKPKPKPQSDTAAGILWPSTEAMHGWPPARTGGW